MYNSKYSRLGDTQKKSLITLPKSLDLEEVRSLVDGYAKSWYERSLIYISYVYNQGLYSSQKNVTVSIHSDLRRLILGSKAIKQKSSDIKENKGKGEKNKETIQQYIILQSLLSPIIEFFDEYYYDPTRMTTHNNYSQSFRLKLRKEKDSFKHQQVYELKTKIGIKILNKLGEYNKKKIEQSIKKHEYSIPVDIVLKSLSKIDYLWEEAEKNGIHENDKTYHELLKNSVLSTHIDEQGRMYHPIVMCSKRLRKYLRYEGERLYEIDATSSQPALHSFLYNVDIYHEIPHIYDESDCLNEKEKYEYLISSGELYSFLNDQLTVPYDLNKEEDKKDLKGRIFGEIFYSFPYTEESEIPELWMVFNRSFPILATKINNLKGKGGSYREVPKFFQWVESQIFFKEVIEESNIFPLISVHDCLLTTEDNIGKIASKIKSSYLKVIGFEIKNKIKQL